MTNNLLEIIDHGVLGRCVLIAGYSVASSSRSVDMSLIVEVQWWKWYCVGKIRLWCPRCLALYCERRFRNVGIEWLGNYRRYQLGPGQLCNERSTHENKKSMTRRTVQGHRAHDWISRRHQRFWKSAPFSVRNGRERKLEVRACDSGTKYPDRGELEIPNAHRRKHSTDTGQDSLVLHLCWASRQQHRRSLTLSMRQWA